MNYKRPGVYFIISFLLALVSYNYVIGLSISGIPPLKYFFNPFSGVLQNGFEQSLPQPAFTIKALTNDVKVVVDEDYIPHLYARNEEDLYFAQGYVTAKERLWQMDFQTRLAAGRLAEVVGESVLEFDRFNRKLGLNVAAKRAARLMVSDSLYGPVIYAYTKGVNEFIRTLEYKDYPFEFKLLNYKPERWSPYKTALLLQVMSLNLSTTNREKYISKAAKYFTEEQLDYFYPIFRPYTEPYISKYEDYEYKPTLGKKEVAYIPEDKITNPTPDEMGIGSNNWAVMGNKTKSGNAILCNDPHLGLQLPSLWYVMQLTTPNSNVYGATLPGAPCVIIGFNENIAWGVTNSYSDALDFYKVEYSDSSKTAYKYDGKVVPFEMRTEVIKIKGGKQTTDIIPYSHLGPVPYTKGETPFFDMIPVDCVANWESHSPNEEAKTFYLLNKAKNHEDYLNALKVYSAPAQNFAYADKEGNVGIVHCGKYKVREFKQGRTIGTLADVPNKKPEYVPFEDIPQEFNPERGFISSANQAPVPPDYKYFLGDYYSYFERGKRINNLLRANDSIDIDYMKMMIGDNYNIYAEMLLKDIEPYTAELKAKNEFVNKLYKWDYRNEAESVEATFIEYLMDGFDYTLWNGVFTPENDTLKVTTRDVTLYTVINFESDTVKQIIGERVYTKQEMVDSAFAIAFRNITNSLGSDTSKWLWKNEKGSVIRHIARLPGFGTDTLSIGGNYNCINAMRETAGPSYRMIVELGEKPEAWFVYPGGQSGAPGSKHYDDMLETWRKNKYLKARFFSIDDYNDEESD